MNTHTHTHKSEWQGFLVAIILPTSEYTSTPWTDREFLVSKSRESESYEQLEISLLERAICNLGNSSACKCTDSAQLVQQKKMFMRNYFCKHCYLQEMWKSSATKGDKLRDGCIWVSLATMSKNNLGLSSLLLIKQDKYAVPAADRARL